jgi:hypothetical protein
MRVFIITFAVWGLAQFFPRLLYDLSWKDALTVTGCILIVSICIVSLFNKVHLTTQEILEQWYLHKREMSIPYSSITRVSRHLMKLRHDYWVEGMVDGVHQHITVSEYANWKDLLRQLSVIIGTDVFDENVKRVLDLE